MSIETSKEVYQESESVWIEYLLSIDKKNITLDRKPGIYPTSDLKLILINSKNDTIKNVGGSVGSIVVKEYPDTLWV
ncbi:MAG: hypothetical protein IPM38_11665 [Ignavibacteria bacterium]|nr:hypothetical protein [Ignavibacteria bacterium]